MLATEAGEMSERTRILIAAVLTVSGCVCVTTQSDRGISY